MPNPENNRKPLEAEIVGQEPSSRYNSYQNNQNDQGYGQFRYARFYVPSTSGGCLSPCITLALILICLGQYGPLAAIGFCVFYVIGLICGSIYTTRRLMAGLPYNIWAWRVGNWLICFLITVWLAGGFKQ